MLGVNYTVSECLHRANNIYHERYLKARRQKVVIKNNSSAYCEISAGVPQGSVLGPLLFIIYINDIADKLISLSRLFADDTSFCYSNQDTKQLKKRLLLMI